MYQVFGALVTRDGRVLMLRGPFAEANQTLGIWRSFNNLFFAFCLLIDLCLKYVKTVNSTMAFWQLVSIDFPPRFKGNVAIVGVKSISIPTHIINPWTFKPLTRRSLGLFLQWMSRPVLLCSR